ncbi:Cobalt-zinc-cadmium resistance protein CzcB [Stieleria maiorica]|uniref:Cobalt-zinc-cadmium resistance protein CzcB n=1 Tax=Stieleria maiorica TaxID=2795974 RepID=A0A5B9MJY6_9BACT|nr:efflux RND transporter periplasmic adaptor subunit [Stieleria maiorica]QEG01529.1 Cobalt-zinc-cadmium resistance protein CzcB [Stieleria maiorica]
MIDRPLENSLNLLLLSCFVFVTATCIRAEEDTKHAGHHQDSHAKHDDSEHRERDHDQGEARTNQQDLHADHSDLDTGHDHDSHSDEDEKHSGHGHDEHSERSEEFLEFPWGKLQREGVEMTSVGPAVIKEKQSFYGETVINGNTLVHVLPRFSGTLKTVLKMLGDSVQAGEVLAIVESNESLSNYKVRAEISGVIIDQDATKGEFVSSEKVLFKLANLETTWANISVPPRLLASLKVGAPATVISQSTDARLDTKITYVRPILSEATRSGQARLELPNNQLKWPPGMFVTVEVVLNEIAVQLAVPESSILLVENKPSVFVKAKAPDGDEGFEIRHLKTGRSDGRWVEILDGLKLKEVVAAGNTFLLKAEMGKSSAEHSH